jgi:hypothetical protein
MAEDISGRDFLDSRQLLVVCRLVSVSSRMVWGIEDQSIQASKRI